MKTVFKNKNFYHLLISYVIILLCWNLYVVFKPGNFLAILPISIQSILLILILTNNHYARIAILVWTIIFIIGDGILVSANMIIDDGFKGVNTYEFAFEVLSIVIGIFIVDYTKRTVIVQRGAEIIDPEIAE